MAAKDFRQSAYNKIKNKSWGTLALAQFVTGLISGVAFTLNFFLYVGWVISLLITGAITYGLTVMALYASEITCSFDQAFWGFKRFGDCLALSLLISIFTFLWSLLLIIPGIVMSHAYAMSYFVMIDKPNLSPNQARKKSIEMMRGHKWELFCLRFSFIGWYLLGILTFGILFYWIIPYQRVAEANFYKHLVKCEHQKSQQFQSVFGYDLQQNATNNNQPRSLFGYDLRQNQFGNNQQQNATNNNQQRSLFGYDLRQNQFGNNQQQNANNNTQQQRPFGNNPRTTAVRKEPMTENPNAEPTTEFPNKETKNFDEFY